MADALELGFDVGGADHVAIGEVAEVELHAPLEAPFERHLVDGDGALFLAQRFVHSRMKVVRRVEVSAVVSGQLHQLHRPAFSVGQILFLQAGEERRDLLESVVVAEVLNLRRKGRRIGQHVVLEVDRQVDELAGHFFFLRLRAAVVETRPQR